MLASLWVTPEMIYDEIRKINKRLENVESLLTKVNLKW